MWVWCCFCGNPLENAAEGWLDVIRTWDQPEEKGDFNTTPPPAPMQTLVTISDEEGEQWSELVCVGPTFNNFVSRRGKIDNWGDVINNNEYGIADNTEPYLPIHPGCLSFLCRRINATPKQIWDSLYSEGSDYPQDKTKRIGLLKGLQYYDIEDYHGGEWHVYCLEKPRLKKNPEEGELELEEYWLDPDTMLPLQWILAQPHMFPTVPSLTLSVPFVSSLTTSQTSFMKIFKFPEIFDIVLNYVIGLDIPQSQLEEELKSDDVFIPPSIMQCTEDVFALLQVNRILYTAIVRDRQRIFLRLAWMHGWMLPSTPEDWYNWGSNKNKPFHNGNDFKVEDGQDWRGYLLMFLDPEDDSIASRWRFQKMAMQFGRGRVEAKDGGKECRLRFPVGELAFRPGVKEPEPWFWEFGGEYPWEEGDGDEDDCGCHC